MAPRTQPADNLPDRCPWLSPTANDGRGYHNVVGFFDLLISWRAEDAVDLTRGADTTGPLTAEDLAPRTGARATLFAKALPVPDDDAGVVSSTTAANTPAGQPRCHDDRMIGM